jgi:hypothetical protein
MALVNGQERHNAFSGDKWCFAGELSVYQSQSAGSFEIVGGHFSLVLCGILLKYGCWSASLAHILLRGSIAGSGLTKSTSWKSVVPRARPKSSRGQIGTVDPEPLTI